MKQKIQIALVIGFLVAAARTAYIFYERHEDAIATAKKAEAPPLNPDYYVTPKKVYFYDLKTAHALTEQPVWVKLGYSSTYYPYSKASHHADFKHEAGTLGPLQKLQIADVVTDENPSGRQVLGIFELQGKTFAVPIGTVNEGQYTFAVNDMFFFQDPHQLYNHWPPDVWAAVDQHQVTPGMNELQASFAVGLGAPDSSTDTMNRTTSYPNGGNPLSVTYRNGKATEITPAK
jgi:hypothetical protein